MNLLQIREIANSSVEELLLSITSEGGRPWVEIVEDAIIKGIRLHENKTRQMATETYKPHLRSDESG